MLKFSYNFQYFLLINLNNNVKEHIYPYICKKIKKYLKIDYQLKTTI